MGALDWVAAKLGYAKPRPRAHYGYDAAQLSNLTASLQAESQFINTTLRFQLRILRARSRQAAQNNPFARRFAQMVVDNVCGPHPFRLQGKVKFNSGALDDKANDLIEDAWKAWGKAGQCEITGKWSWNTLQRLLIRNLAIDGELLFRKLRGPQYGAQGFRLQIIDVDRLHELKNEALDNGGAIHAGVEVDPAGKPIAYWLLKRKPSQWQFSGYTYEYDRVPAEDIVHLFVPEFAEQLRGVPWMFAALLNLVHLGAFEEAAVIAARVGAANMGFIQAPDGGATLAEQQGKDAAAPGSEPSITADPGSFQFLPPGYQMSGWNPKFPDAAVEPFIRACLRGVAAGLGVAYHNLANDLENVNYSSARIGELDERDAWMTLQNFITEHLHQPLFEDWLQVQVLAGKLRFDPGRLDKYKDVHWQGRRWAWVDPLKEVGASIEAINAKLKSRTRIASEGGEDLEETFEEIQQEQVLAASMNISLDPVAPKAAGIVNEQDVPPGDAGDAAAGGDGGKKDNGRVHSLPRWRDAAYRGIEMKREDRKTLRQPTAATAIDIDMESFRKLDPTGRLRQLRGQHVERLFSVERDSIDKEARTAWLSIASEQPYERWWGVEILDLKKESIRDGRLKSGAPLLVGHDTADQVGVVERHEITMDKKLRILARFGRSQRAEEIFQDVLDGIRRNTSVGYIIHDLVLEKQEEDVCTYRVTDWEPLEGSLVAVPADPSVGVGRSAEHDPNIELNRRSDMDPAEKARIEAETRAKVEAEFKEKARIEAQQRADAEAAARNTPDAVRARETERVSGLLAAGDEYAVHGGAEVARECIKDPNASIETFKSRMFEKMRGGAAPTKTAAAAQGATAYGEGARVLYSHGALKAFRDLPIQGGGVMKAEEAAHRAGMWLAAAVYRKPWAIQYCKEHGVPMLMRDQETMQVRVMTENVLSAGGALVPIEMEAAIIMLRDSYGVARRLARNRAMQSDTLVIPRRTGGVTAYFFQDDDGSGITASDKGWDNVGLSAKKLGALTKVSKDLIEDAVISVVDDLAQEIAYAFAKKEDQCLIIGDGTSTYGGMTGINTKFEATAYASRIAAASGHDLPSEIDNADLTSAMGGVSQYAVGKGAVWLCSALIKSVIFGRLKATAGGNRVDTLGAEPDDQYLGYPIVTSEVMPSVTSTLNAKVIATFGRFDMAASIGTRRGIEMQTLVERYAELGLIGVLGTERFDMNVHDLGSTSVKGPVAAVYGN